MKHQKDYEKALEEIHTQIKRGLIMLNNLSEQVIQLKIAVRNDKPIGLENDRWAALERNFK